MMKKRPQPKESTGLLGELAHDIKKEALGRKSCQTFTFTFVFWLVFVITRLVHRNEGSAYLLQKEIKNMLEIGSMPTPMEAAARLNGTTSTSTPVSLKSVKTWAGVMEWLGNSVVPLLWSGSRDSQLGLVLEFNRVLGGVRLKQQRRLAARCRGPDELILVYRLECYAMHGPPTLTPLQGTLPGVGQIALPDSKGNYEYWLDLHSSKPESQVLAEIDSLRALPWALPSTKFITAESILYSAQKSVFLIVQADFEFHGAGGLRPQLKILVLPASVYLHTGAIVGDVILGLLLFYLAAGEVLGLVTAIRKKKVKKHLFRAHRAANLIILLIGFGFAVFNGHLATSTTSIVESIPAALSVSGAGSSNGIWRQHHDSLNSIYDKLTALGKEIQYCDLMAFWYTLIIQAKILMTFHANPQLAVITETLSVAFWDLVHFFIVFALTFVNFAVGAHFLFGHQLQEWSNVFISLVTCFRTLMGDIDFMAMYDITPWMSMIWFWLFMILIYLVLVNMFISIVMDAYANVKEKSNKVDSFVDLAKRLYQRIRKRYRKVDDSGGGSAPAGGRIGEIDGGEHVAPAPLTMPQGKDNKLSVPDLVPEVKSLFFQVAELRRTLGRLKRNVPPPLPPLIEDGRNQTMHPSMLASSHPDPLAYTSGQWTNMDGTGVFY